MRAACVCACPRCFPLNDPSVVRLSAAETCGCPLSRPHRRRARAERRSPYRAPRPWLQAAGTRAQPDAPKATGRRGLRPPRAPHPDTRRGPASRLPRRAPPGPLRFGAAGGEAGLSGAGPRAGGVWGRGRARGPLSPPARGGRAPPCVGRGLLRSRDS